MYHPGDNLFPKSLLLPLTPFNLGYMTVRKVNLYSLCVFALFTTLALWRGSARNGFDWLDVFFLFIFAIIAWAVGILLGLGLAVIVKRPAIEPYLYLTGQVAVVLMLVLIEVITTHTERKQERTVENINDNHRFVDLDNRQSIPYRMDCIRTAFRKLESASGDPNSFHLERFSSRYKDTLINSIPDTIFSVLFTYLKDDKVRFANVTVLRDSAVINAMDSERKPDQDKRFTKFGVWERPIDREEMKNRLKDLPDSTRKKITDILSE